MVQLFCYVLLWLIVTCYMLSILFPLFTEAALWARSVIELRYLSVCMWRRETPTSGCHGDLWSKKVFLILACDDTILKKRRGYIFLLSLFKRAVLDLLWIVGVLAGEDLWLWLLDVCTSTAHQRHFNGTSMALPQHFHRTFMAQQKNSICASIRIRRESQCIPYAGFLKKLMCLEKCSIFKLGQKNV